MTDTDTAAVESRTLALDAIATMAGTAADPWETLALIAAVARVELDRPPADPDRLTCATVEYDTGGRTTTLVPDTGPVGRLLGLDYVDAVTVHGAAGQPTRVFRRYQETQR